MRTTVAINDRVLVAARARAHELELTLGQLVELALQRELAADPSPPTGPTIPVFREGTGVRPGVDVTSARGLHEALDEDQPVERLR